MCSNYKKLAIMGIVYNVEQTWRNAANQIIRVPRNYHTGTTFIVPWQITPVEKPLLENSFVVVLKTTRPTASATLLLDF